MCKYIQKNNNVSNLFLFFTVFFLIPAACFSQTGAQWRSIEASGYYSEDIFVAAYTDIDHPSIDKSGTTNSRDGIQELLDRLGAAGGGTLYLSAGKYKIDGLLLIPKGVVLRGDWRQPAKDAPLTGTILMAYAGRGSEDESNAFITMESSGGLYNVAIWYPEQLPGNITPYPPSVLYGKRGYWGNDYCNVRNVTLVNSYSGIVVSRHNGGGCPNIFNLYGSPLSRGIEIDNIADVGRFDRIDFSPDYWSASGLPGSPTKEGQHRSYIRKNATGVVMRRNDWSYTCYLTVEGYHTGFYTGVSMSASDPSGGQPNGHNYHLTFKDCTEAIHLGAAANAGIMFTHVRIADCDYGIVAGEGLGSAIQLSDCEISANEEAIKIPGEASVKLMTQQCKIHDGEVNIDGGIYVSMDGDFNNEPPQVTVGVNGRIALTGNRFAQSVEIKNNSLFESAIDHQPVSVKPLPAFPEMRPKETKPARNSLYVVTDAEFGGIADAVFDNTVAIQDALDKAGTEGGGIVFLPPGKYRVDGNLTVPSGVEIKGASDLASVPKGQGSIIEIYAGKDDPDGTPFLRLSERSGIRGITFNYPEQKSSMAKDLATLPKYPYCMQATGADVYIVNVGLRATYKGIDLFTHKCDNHYVDYLAGHVYRNAIRIGGGSTNGVISNVQFNTIVMASGYEVPKFGGWPNSENDPDAKAALYNQNWIELEFMILDDCKDQILYNDFHYASHKGLVFGRNGTMPSGISMGLGLDASLRSICFESLDPDKGFDLINTQVVSVARDVYAETKFIETSPDFAGEAFLFSSDYWGSAKYGGVFGGGTVNFILPHFAQYGAERFLEITGDASVYIFAADMAATNFVSNGKSGQVSVESSVVALTSPSGYHSWWNNLSIAPVLLPQATLSRRGWIAAANTGDASAAIDGNAATRWTPGAQTSSGQWFAVDTRQPITFNTIILDASRSPNDWPGAYAVYVSESGRSWGDPIATGTQQSSVVIISIPETTAQYVRVMQTSSGRAQYWSIHEFYLAYTGEPSGGTGNPISKAEMQDVEPLYMYHANGSLHIVGFHDTSGKTLLEIYTVTGQKLFADKISSNSISISNLPTGIYIALLRDGKRSVSNKIIIK